MIKAKVNGSAELVVEKHGSTFRINGTEQSIDMKELQPGSYHLLINGLSFQVEVIASDSITKTHKLRLNGKVLEVSLTDRYDELLKELGMDASSAQRVGDLKAPMPGLVVEVPVQEGQQVSKGDTLLILEAMKMENALKATSDATVKKIAVKKGDAVEKNTVLIHLS
jgi:acetyl/propionyl-CoA carboxylase alpha subunit